MRRLRPRLGRPDARTSSREQRLVAAGGAAQPFRDRSFDAVVLTDVLC